MDKVRAYGCLCKLKYKQIPAAKRLHGLSLEERLQGLSPEDLDRLRALLTRKN